MIDLPTSIGVGVEVGGIGSSVKGVNIGNGTLKMRNGGAMTSGPTGGPIMPSGPLQRTRLDDKESRGRGGESERVKHYDADGDYFSLPSGLNGTNIKTAFVSSSSYQGHCIRGYSHPCIGGYSLDF